MGCGSSTAVRAIDSTNSKNKKFKRPLTPGPKSIAFEIDINENKNPNKNRIPKRLQHLEEQPNNVLTAENIKLRQKLAEKRRKSVLADKVFKSKQFQAKVSSIPESETKKNNEN